MTNLGAYHATPCRVCKVDVVEVTEEGLGVVLGQLPQQPAFYKHYLELFHFQQRWRKLPAR